MAPFTLLQRSGVTAKVADWTKAVLVIIDAQNDYADGSLPLSGVADATREIQSLLGKARADGVPVVHVVHLSGADSWLFAAGSHGAGIMPALTPAGGEPIISKTLPNAFAGTELQATLAAIAADTGRTELLIEMARGALIGAPRTAHISRRFRHGMVCQPIRQIRG
ncbi:isochorismatase family protein [Rhizobium sp. BE258]|uniref:isochorismatase family protein n=1 Tax=Rhizobium sp. BE258 TaxID=2817722 RepID=UPI0028596AF3|nr:isochorismatase family protein [Rhizobium sp. BE258]MDR7142952.1 isochorismate hydrolase [Rhizobium sp. BE258]